MSGFMHGLMEEIAAASDAAPVEAAPTIEAPSVADPAPVVKEAPVVDAPAPAVEAAPAPESRRATVVAMSRFNALAQEHDRNVAALTAATAQTAALQEQLARAMAAQNPVAAAEAAKTATSEVDWIQKMLDEGAELPAELVSGMRAQQARTDKLEQALAVHDQRAQADTERAANRDYDSGFAKLQAKCDNWNPEFLHTMLARGVTAREIVGMYDQAHTGQPSLAAPVAAAPARVRPAPPPQLDAPATPSRPAVPPVETAESFREFLRTSLH